MDLHLFALSYLSERPGLSVGYRRLMAAAVESLCAFAGRPLLLADVDRPVLAKWAEDLARTHRASTVNGKIRLIRTLLMAAYDDALLDRPPRRVRRIPETTLPPEAWTVDEVRLLLAHLSQLPGWVGELPASSFWYSLTLVVYWTGGRISSVKSATAEDYTPGKGLVVRESKTGRGQFHPLPESCCKELDGIMPESGMIWPWPCCRRLFWMRFRGFVDAVGLPSPRGTRSLFYKLRRTTASYCAAVDPSLAQQQLGHSSLAMTRRYYIDPRVAAERSAADVLPDPSPERPRLRVVG